MFDSFERVTDLKKERRQLQCHECHQRSIHTLEAKCIGKTEQIVGLDMSVDWGTDFLVFRCGNCDGISFIMSSWCSEDMDVDDEGQGYLQRSEKQYPPPTSSEFTFNTEFIPTALKDVLDEMLYALAGGKLRLATIAIRMAIEFIVTDAKCKGGNLSKKIDDLRHRNLIDEQQQELLHKIRLKGNATAHEFMPMSKKEMVASMGVIELLLEAFYNRLGRTQRIISLAQGAFADPARVQTQSA